MVKLNFKLRLLLCFLAASIIPVVLAGIFINKTYDEKIQQDFKSFNYTYVQNQMDKIEQLLGQKETELRSIAQAFSHLEQHEIDINAFLRDQKSVIEYYTNLYIITPDGSVYTGDPSYKAGVIDYSRLHSYTNARKAQELVWLEPYTDVVSGRQCIGLSISLADRQGGFRGVLVGNISMKTFGEMLTNGKYMEDEEIFLINQFGNVKFHSTGKYSETVNLTDKDFVLYPAADSISKVQEGYREFSYLGRDWTCSFFQVNENGWKVLSLADTNAVKKAFSSMNQNIYSITYLLVSLCILLGLLFSLFMSRSFTAPLMELRSGVMAIAAGNLDSKIEMDRNDEIKEVAEAFNKMAASLKYTYTNLLKRTEELYSNNKELQNANTELEASYGQLAAAMAQLNESEEKYRTLMGNISDMVIVINPEDKLSYINNSVEKVLGYKESELMGESIHKIAQQGYQGFDELVDSDSDYKEVDWELQKKDGTLIKVEGSTKRVMEGQRVVSIQAIARDVTQRSMMELQLRKNYEELQIMNRISNTLASTLDLNNMLSIVINHVVEISHSLVCAIRLVGDNEPWMLELKALKGVMSEKYDRSNIDIRTDICGQAFDKKAAVIVEFENEESIPYEYYKMLYNENGAKCVVFTPIMIKAKVIGILCATLKEKPERDLVELIGSLANNIAIAIDNAKAYETLKHSYMKTVQSLVSVVEAKDVYTESHSIRVAKYSSFIAGEMGFDKGFIEDIWVAGVLHDIGKIGISDSILNKAGLLTDEEYNAIKQHPAIAYKIVSKIGLGDNILKAIKHHHERYDGRGYPDRIKDDEISIMAAIISVADAFDAMTSNRPYKEPRSISQGINEIAANRGTQFHPRVAQAFETAYLLKREVFEKIYRNEEIEFF